MWPPFLALLSRYAGARYQRSVQGLSSSVGSFIGLISGALLYGAVGPTMFLAPAVLILAAVALSLRFVALAR